MALVIRNVTKSFGDFSVSLDITVGEGETLVMAGPSGCGKTTALHLISGLLEADGGEIILNGKDISQTPPWQRNIAMVFQDLALFPHLNVEKNIAYAPSIQGIKKDERRKIAGEYLSLVHLSGYGKRRIHTLSGGEKQRIAIARALASKPDCLLFDEPFSSLDTPLRRELRDQFLEIRKELGIPCIFVTHDREEAAVTADRIAVMDKGRVVETGSPRALFLYPKTKIAAEFFGFGKVFQCNPKYLNKEKILIQSALGELEIPVKNQPKTKSRFFFLPKDAVRLTDAIQLANNKEQSVKSTKKITAVFKRAVYRGDSLSYELELPSRTTLSIDADIRKSIPQEGSPVSLMIDQSLIHFVE